MKKLGLIIVLFTISMTLFAEDYDDIFWNKIKIGDFESAAIRSSEYGTNQPQYHLFSAITYILLNNKIETSRQFELFSEGASDYPPELFEEEFNHYLQKPNGNIYAYIGLFVSQYQNLFSLNSQNLMYKAYKEDNRNYIANNYLSMYEFNKGNIKKSLDHALVSIEESENYSEPYVNAANSLDKLGRTDEAKEIIFRALNECQEPHFNTYLWLFYEFGESGSGIVQNFNQSLMASIIHIDEDSLDFFYDRISSLPDVYFHLIYNLIEKGCYSEAKYLLSKPSVIIAERESYLEVRLYFKAYSQNSFNNSLQNYIKTSHTDSELLADVAYMALQFESYRYAINLYKEFIRIQSDIKSSRLMTSYSNIGTSYANLEDFENAFKYWDLALKIDPNDEITLANVERYSKNRQE